MLCGALRCARHPYLSPTIALFKTSHGFWANCKRGPRGVWTVRCVVHLAVPAPTKLSGTDHAAFTGSGPVEVGGRRFCSVQALGGGFKLVPSDQFVWLGGTIWCEGQMTNALICILATTPPDSFLATRISSSRSSRHHCFLLFSPLAFLGFPSVQLLEASRTAWPSRIPSGFGLAGKNSWPRRRTTRLQGSAPFKEYVKTRTPPHGWCHVGSVAQPP